MKVKLKCGDSITIPDGCKAIVKDGSVVFEKEEKEEAKTQDFKDGDVLTSLFDNKVVFIFKEDELKQKENKNDYYVCHIYVSSSIGYTIEVPTKDNLSFCGHKDEVRLATNKEKQFLFDKMKEQGLLWNAGEKRVEKVRWRAKKGDRFYCFDTDFSVLDGLEEGSKLDDSSWRSYNYFRTAEQVKEAIKRMTQELRKYHDEIGE
nr:hypothetical protein [uncultured Prevotella sp.]